MLSKKERKVAKIGHPIRVLIVEDSEDDTELMLRHLRKGGFYPKFRRVQSAIGLQNALKNEKWELILCDHNMPGFDSVTAQKIVNKKHPFIPFMLISDSIPASVADTVQKNGARAMIPKSNLNLLVPAVVKELKAVIDAKKRVAQNQTPQQKVISNKIRQGRYGTTISLFADQFSKPASKNPQIEPTKKNGLGNDNFPTHNGSDKETDNPVNNILIVEDELIQSILLEKLIKNLGHKVVGKAISGADAIKMALNLQPDLITMDISLQDDIDGIMATMSIQDKCMIPVIYISGNSDKYNLERAEKTNYIDFIRKPVCKESLAKSFAKANELKTNNNI